MSLTIPNAASATYPEQAQVDTMDLHILAAGSGATGTVSGCGVTVVSALTVRLAAGYVSIAGTRVTVTQQDFALTADPTQKKLYLISVNTSGTGTAEAGSAAAAPSFPDVTAAYAIPPTKSIQAAIMVPAGAVSLTANNITDRRVMLPASNALAEYVRVSAYVPANGMTGTAIQAALDAAAGTKPVLIDTPGTYIVSTAIILADAWTNTVLEAVSGVTLQIDPASAYYLQNSRAIIKSPAAPTPKADLASFTTTAYPVGSYLITVASTSGWAVGDLVSIGLQTLTSLNEMEDRRIRRIVSGTQFELDFPLATDYLNNASAKRLQIYAQRSLTLKGITFDTALATQGSGAVHVLRYSRVHIDNCHAITGGRSAFEVLFSSYALVEHSTADGFAYVTTGFATGGLDARTGITRPMITTTGTEDVFGQAYGFYIAATVTVVRDCWSRGARHNFASGNSPHQSYLVWYDNCVSEADQEGGFDWHGFAQHCYATNCVATGGYIGFVIRGPRQQLFNCASMDETYALKMFDWANYTRVRGFEARNCAVVLIFGSGWSGGVTTHDGGTFEDFEVAGTTQDVLRAQDVGHTYRNFTFRNWRIRSGSWECELAGAWQDTVFEDWDILGTPTGSGNTNAPVHILADTGTATCRGLAVRRFRINGLAGNPPPVVYLNKAAAAGNLADNTYEDVTVEDITYETTGSAPAALVVVANNAGAVPATVAGYFSKRRIRKNGVWVEAPSITGSRAGNAALASLLTDLAAKGDILNNTSA